MLVLLVYIYILLSLLALAFINQTMHPAANVVMKRDNDRANLINTWSPSWQYYIPVLQPFKDPVSYSVLLVTTSAIKPQSID